MTDMEPKKRKSGPHFTKVQKAWQEAMLIEHGLQDEFKPSGDLAEVIAQHFIALRTVYIIDQKELAAYKAKSLFSIIKERVFK